MEVFEVVTALLMGGAILATLARRIGAPYPALVALAGAVLALIPGVPTLELNPELALVLFVAPVLLDAAYDASPRDLRTNWRAVTSLALGAVVLTVAAVAIVAKLLVPAMPWAVAIALGAIVAPPDAAAATAVLQQLRPPHQLLVILEGESLFNDASALLIYRLTVAATLTGALSGWDVLPTLLIITFGSVVLGLLLTPIVQAIATRIDDVSIGVVFQFCGAFGIWTLAERLHLSGIITVVVFAMSAARRSPGRMPARMRIPSWAIWEVAVFILNVLAFILVGFQLKSIAERMRGGDVMASIAMTVAVCITVIVARIAWVILAAAVGRWRRHMRKKGGSGPLDAIALPPRSAAIVGWCGMRGTVTLATALALPTLHEGGVDFPYRDLIIVVAFGVVLGTLVLQGLTLRPLLLRLKLEDDGMVEREVHMARVETLQAAVASIAAFPETATVTLVRAGYDLQLRRAEQACAQDTADQHEADHAHDALQGEHQHEADDDDVEAAVIRTAIRAQRQRLGELRATGTIGNAAFQRIEEALDWAELDWAHMLYVGTEHGADDHRHEI